METKVKVCVYVCMCACMYKDKIALKVGQKWTRHHRFSSTENKINYSVKQNNISTPVCLTVKHVETVKGSTILNKNVCNHYYLDGLSNIITRESEKTNLLHN